MNNGSGPDDATHASEQPQPASNPGGPPSKRRGPVPLKSPQSLERLRERVKQAAHELERLRKENAALATRLQRLETHADVDFDGTVLAFDTDPEDLREKVEGFIKTIDAYLARENE